MPTAKPFSKKKTGRMLSSSKFCREKRMAKKFKTKVKGKTKAASLVIPSIPWRARKRATRRKRAIDAQTGVLLKK